MGWWEKALWRQYQASIEEQVHRQAIRQEEFEQELEDRENDFEEHFADLTGRIEEIEDSSFYERPSGLPEQEIPWDVIVAGDPNNLSGITIPIDIRNQLLEELTLLDPNIENDAFIYEPATFSGGRIHPQFESHRRLWVCRLAECVNLAIPAGLRIGAAWTDAGEMVVFYEDSAS